MKVFIVAVCVALCLAACSEASKTSPNAPKSIADVNAAIKGKKYKVVQLGLLSPFTYDTANPVNWKIQKEDTSKFFREYAAEQNQFTLDVSADSTASFFDANNKKMVKAVYAVDDVIEEGYKDTEKPGIKLRLKYSDSLDFGGQKTAAQMTQSYLVRGLSANELVLETTNAFNNRKVVLWLQTQ